MRTDDPRRDTRTDEDVVVVSKPAEGVLHVTLNRPEVMNAFSAEVSRLFNAALDVIDQGDIRVVVVTGAGDRAFSAGNDIWEMSQLTREENEALQAEREALLWRWATLPIPTIAALNGLCAGYGTLVAVSADLRVGCPRSTITVTASSYGSANLTFVLPQLIGWSHTKDILLTGRKLPPDEGFSMGLLNRLVSNDEVIPASIQLAVEIASKPTAGVRSVKTLLHHGLGRTFEDLYQREITAMAAVKGGTIDDLFGEFITARRPSAPTHVGDD